MDSKPERPLRLFVNPFAIWTDLALKTGQAMWSSYAAAARPSAAPRIAVIPTADAPAPKLDAPAPSAHRSPRPARAKLRRKPKAKAKARAKAKRRARR
jgi:hypothetical protein